MPTRFTPNYEKMLEAIVWLVSKRDHLDRFKIAKILFYADRDHLRRYGRPVIGDRYIAMKDGPVPSAAYDILKKNPPGVSLPFRRRVASSLQETKRDGARYPEFRALRNADLGDFSESDIERLSYWLKVIGPMDPMVLWRKVHKEPEYKKAWASRQSGGEPDIDYEEMLDPNDPNYDEIKSTLAEASSVAI